MKKILLLCVFAMLSWQTKAQTIAIQFYVDANNNCAYNLGEQLLYNIPCNLTYVQSSGTLQTAYGGNSVTTCGAFTMYVWSPSVTATNTLSIIGSGIAANLSCNNYTNIPYNTNTTQYLPVTITGTSSIGAQVNSFNYYSGSGSYSNSNLSLTNNTLGICSNIGTDTMSLYFNIFNYFGCNTTSSISPRTYSLFLDGVNYDVLTANGGFSSFTSTVGVNAMSNMTEYYMNGQTTMYLYPKLPSTFTALGSHTFEVKTSMIYNDPLATLNFSCILNSIPCAKISGSFYNDCNNNCTFDAGDTYGIGSFATGLIYNASTGFNLTFNPNWFNGNFSVYLPSTSAYSLTQYPTYTTSPYNFTACSNATVTIPASATTNTFMFGYTSSAGMLVDPGVTLYRSSSTSTLISPNVGATFDVALYNSWWNVCGSSALNPGKLKITLPKFINYVSTVSGPTPTFVTGSSSNPDTLIWAVPNFTTGSWWLNSFASFSVIVSSTAIATTTFDIKAYIFPTTDGSLSNNIYTWTRYIGGPFDPNGKYTDAPGLLSNGDVPFGTQKFNYTIGFQNIGDAPAINVKTLDTMDINFDLTTLRVLQSSFPVSAQIDHVSRLVAFHFNGINLPGIATDEPKSHGFVRYEIKLKPGVAVNTILKNRGHNYFDYNEPVATNQTSNKLVVLATAIDEFGKSESSINAVPNPFSTILKITSSKEMKKVQVFNLVGELVLNANAEAGEIDLNLENLAPAIYLVRVTSSDNKVSTIKVVKQ